MEKETEVRDGANEMIRTASTVSWWFFFYHLPYPLLFLPWCGARGASAKAKHHFVCPEFR